MAIDVRTMEKASAQIIKRLARRTPASARTPSPSKTARVGSRALVRGAHPSENEGRGQPAWAWGKCRPKCPRNNVTNTWASPPTLPKSKAVTAACCESGKCDRGERGTRRTRKTAQPKFPFREWRRRPQ